METFAVATIKSWNIENFKRLASLDNNNNWVLITDKSELTADRLKELSPRYVFFPHWSWIIPREIYEEFECVVFHMTDLPFGRGGSPLQNLIVRGITDSKVSAIRVEEGIDTGPVYMKEPVSLEGTAEDILRRVSDLSFGMMRRFISERPTPLPQEGEVVEFARRKPGDGNIASLDTIEKIYDYIRMLDAEGYPHAFMETDGMRFEFHDARLDNDSLSARVKIYKK